MLNLKPILSHAFVALLGAAVGAGLTTRYIWNKSVRSDFYIIEMMIRKDLALLSEIESGNPTAAKMDLDRYLTDTTKLTNAYAIGPNGPTSEAKELQRHISKWRTDHPNISLSPKLEAAIQNASSASR